MKYGLGVNVNETIHETVGKSVLAEKFGFDHVWVSDVPEQRYAPVVAAAIAAGTKRIKIGLGLLSPFVHSSLQIASSVVTLVETYGERFELCIGPGDRNQLKRIGINLTHQRGISDYLLTAKKEIEKTLRKHKVDCPIWLGAQGPKMLRVSQFFDGVLLNYGSSELIKWAVDQVGQAKDRDFKHGIYALSYVYAKHDPKIHKLLKVSCAAVTLGASKTVLEKLGLAEEVAQANKALEDGVSLDSIANLIPDRSMEFFSIHKRSGKLGAFLAELSGLGIEHVVFGYPQNHSKQTVRQLSQALKLKP